MHNNGCSVPGEMLRHHAPNAPRGSGHPDHLAGEVENVRGLQGPSTESAANTTSADWASEGEVCADAGDAAAITGLSGSFGESNVICRQTLGTDTWIEQQMRVAGIQAAPVFGDPQATTEKVLELMKEAAAGGADLCAFPETFLPGYPFWLSRSDGAKFNDPEQKAAYGAYVEGAVAPDGPEIAAISAASAELGIFTYLGFVERSASGGSVYASLGAFHPDDGIVSIHRKLRPTYEERLVWSAGDGHGLVTHDWAGFRVGGLNCWENWMPLARYSLYAQGEQLHIATWPGSPWLTRDITRFIALEGRVFVVSAGGVLAADDIPDRFPLKDRVLQTGDRFMSGGTYIVGPDGRGIEGPAKGEETILYADLEISTVLSERQNFDPAGHYHRPDVFDVRIRTDRQEPLTQ